MNGGKAAGALASSRRGIGAVAEVQGLYGPFAFSERLLQKIWLRGDFDRSQTRTLDGRRVNVVHPGRWNALGGPDFRQARLSFADGAESIGDVELHLHAGDWAAHRHAADPAYDNVRLHVVLFSPPAGYVTRGVGGAEIPVLVLLPLLHHDLEEYAAEEAVELMANRPASQIIETLGEIPQAELQALVERLSAVRWRQKVHFAQLRVRRLGWEAACHQTALEILGYRYNRAPMLRVAGARALGEWGVAGFSAEAVYDSERPGWSLQGIRPANHPRRRLEQYLGWVQARPDWPVRLKAAASGLPRLSGLGVTGEVRRAHRFTTLRRQWAKSLCAEEIGGTRFDNLVCDGFLPLLASQAEAAADLQAIWFHWFPGDLPPHLTAALRQLGIFGGRTRPACHGAAQGLLGWLIERERQAAAPVGPGSR